MMWHWILISTVDLLVSDVVIFFYNKRRCSVKISLEVKIKNWNCEIDFKNWMFVLSGMLENEHVSSAFYVQSYDTYNESELWICLLPLYIVYD